MEDLTDLVVAIVRGGAGYARVILRGRIDQCAAQRLRTQLGAVLDTGARYLTVDFTEVNGCEEDGLAVLAWAACRASAQQGWLALNGVNHHIRFAPR